MSKKKDPYFVSHIDVSPKRVTSGNGSMQISSTHSIQHTIGHVKCPACLRNQGNMSAEQFSRLPFEVASELWLTQHSAYIQPTTVKSYRDYIKRLMGFFRGMKLANINNYHLRTYQQEMISRISAGNINHDISLLLQILEMGGLRKECQQHFRPLPVKRWEPPKILEPHEEDRFFKVAASNPVWEVAALASIIANNTSACGKELRYLRVQNIHLDHAPPYLSIPDSKNQYRLRTIPLNKEAEAALKRALDRGRELGVARPDHFVFPLWRRMGGGYDPERPASAGWIYTSFRAIRNVAGLPKWFTPHCWRHAVITRLLENGIPEQTVMSIAGHVNPCMMRHYSHTRMGPKAVALEDMQRKTAAKK